MVKTAAGLFSRRLSKPIRRGARGMSLLWIVGTICMSCDLATQGDLELSLHPSWELALASLRACHIEWKLEASQGLAWAFDSEEQDGITLPSGGVSSLQGARGSSKDTKWRRHAELQWVSSWQAALPDALFNVSPWGCGFLLRARIQTATGGEPFELPAFGWVSGARWIDTQAGCVAHIALEWSERSSATYLLNVAGIYKRCVDQSLDTWTIDEARLWQNLAARRSLTLADLVALPGVGMSLLSVGGSFGGGVAPDNAGGGPEEDAPGENRDVSLALHYAEHFAVWTGWSPSAAADREGLSEQAGSKQQSLLARTGEVLGQIEQAQTVPGQQWLPPSSISLRLGRNLFLRQSSGGLVEVWVLSEPMSGSGGSAPLHVSARLIAGD